MLYQAPDTQYIARIMAHKLLYSGAILAALAGCAVAPPAPQPPAERAQAVPLDPDRSEALFHALLLLGVDYRYGGRSPATGFDCSGLVAHVFEQAWGLRLPHNAHAQSGFGMPVAHDALQPGDLVFYDTLNRPFSHVGIYMGEGRFIHAPRAGAQIRIESLQSRYWRTRFNGARRLDPPTGRF
jgi:cell wall-associated NlpC family hydrolase